MSMAPDEWFHRLVEPCRRELRLHCYRMLGSAHDTEDVVQETLVRAWRARGSLRDPSMARPWLYRIATNVCLDELEHRKDRPLPSSVLPPGDPAADPVPPGPDAASLEPCPDPWLAGLVVDPAGRYELKESIALAFVAALQCLSARQRAVLLLRDVVGMSAEETADALGTTASGIDSTLYRARASLGGRSEGPEGAARVRYSSEIDDGLLERYVRAWEARDVDAFIALLHEDVVLNMPPSPTWFRGRDAVATFYATHAFALEGALGFVHTRANGQQAFGFYVGGALTAIHLVRVAAGRVVEMHHLMTPECFDLFELPRAVPVQNTAPPRVHAVLG